MAGQPWGNPLSCFPLLQVEMFKNVDAPSITNSALTPLALSFPLVAVFLNKL